jgi:hypothetical protein
MNKVSADWFIYNYKHMENPHTLGTFLAASTSKAMWISGFDNDTETSLYYQIKHELRK